MLINHINGPQHRYAEPKKWQMEENGEKHLLKGTFISKALDEFLVSFIFYSSWMCIPMAAIALAILSFSFLQGNSGQRSSKAEDIYWHW